MEGSILTLCGGLRRHKARLINGKFRRMFYGQPRMNGGPRTGGFSPLPPICSEDGRSTGAVEWSNGNRTGEVKCRYQKRRSAEGVRTPTSQGGNRKRLQEKGACSPIETKKAREKSRQLRIQYKRKRQGKLLYC